MALRDADSLHLETSKVPELRRRGRVEPMAMPAIDAELIEQFVEQVTTEADRSSLGDSSVAVPFVDGEGAAYTVTIHRAQQHPTLVYQLVARRTAMGRAAAAKAPSIGGGAGAGGGGVGGAGGVAGGGGGYGSGAGAASGSGGAAALAAASSSSPTSSSSPSSFGPGAAALGVPAAGSAAATVAAAAGAPPGSAWHAPPAEAAGGWVGPGFAAPLRGAGRRAPSELLGPGVIAALLEARERGASDVFLSTERPPRLRVQGQLVDLDHLAAAGGGELDAAALEAELGALHGALAGAGAARHGDAGSADFAVEVQGVRARCNVFAHLDGFGLAVRLLRDDPPTLAELGLPAGVAAAVEHREGLVLVCGPTGAGKSTTCAALLRQLDAARAAHVITLEDPIEYRLRARRGLIHQRELGTHTSSFASGLRAALRESPDVILLGELRDAETVAAALTAAETGHLVLATMHAPNAAGAVDRILDTFDEGRQRQARTQLAGSLRMVITQHLLPRRGGGRIAAAEVVPVTAAVANIIRKGELQTLATAIQSGREAGLIPLERSLAELVQRHQITEADARRVAGDAQLLRAQLG